ncbi:HAD family hydrolase [Neolewinella antarctica]|uniref:HAD superfamily hydrolase (TIGR01509 family) n=1 Tax=Neolewinella antarctica TaxID=442734 RepID=A0ABX0XGL6_9BACT|nr:HAD family phosphatase [Neolewinella antarctica]NJC28478.1 HAD superfamily hydrolase (TIGR01509 family) [Neolewinella antarctica]
MLDKQFKGLLCDLDGTLADSEPQHCEAWLDVLNNDYGLSYDEHWFEQYVGTSDQVLSADVIEAHGLSVDQAELISQKQVRFHDVIRTSGTAFPGIKEALREVADAFPLAIATNSGRADTDVVVPALGLDSFTDVVVTATDVANLKPSPDIYLLAAKKLGLDPRDCIAIEDSKPGGTAAKAAGCYLIGLNDKVTGADEMIVDNAAAIRRALELLKQS